MSRIPSFKRKTRTNSADNHIDGIRELVQESLDAAAAAEIDEPTRQAKSPRQEQTRRKIKRRSEHQAEHSDHDACNNRIEIKSRHGHLHARLLNEHFQRRRLDILVAQLLALFKILQCIVNRLATLDRLGLLVANREFAKAIRCGELDLFQSFVGLFLPRDRIKKEYVGQCGDGEHNQYDETKLREIKPEHFCAPIPPS